MSMSYNSPSIGDLLVATLCSAKNTRRFYAIIREREFKRYNKKSVRVALSRLHSKGYVNNSVSGWSITKKGKKYSQNIRPLEYITSPFAKDSPPSMIISFDIPEKDRAKRHWLRNQIKIFGYKMLQQSLWIGPSPLPLSFLKRLEDLGIRKNIKTFKITKGNN
jgi:DNA-binding transcriptional regulator PaaX